MALTPVPRPARSALVATLSLCIGFVSVAQGSLQTVEPGRLARIVELVEEAIAQHQLPGAVVVVGRGEQILYSHVFGRRAVLPAAEPMTEDTIFDLASLTKVIAT